MLIFFGEDYFFNVPDWWYTVPLIDWPIRQVLLSIRGCYRKFWNSRYVKIVRGDLMISLDVPTLVFWAKWDFYGILVKPFPHFYDFSVPNLLVLHVGMHP